MYELQAIFKLYIVSAAKDARPLDFVAILTSSHRISILAEFCHRILLQEWRCHD